MGQILSDRLCDGFGCAVSAFLKNADWNTISCAINLMAMATPCSAILLSALSDKANSDQQRFHQEMVESIAELKNFMSAIDRKIDKVLQADMEAALLALQSSTGADDEALSHSYLSNAISLFMRAISQEQNTRKVQAVFNLGLCQILQGDLKNGWTNLFDSIKVPYVESPNESKEEFLQNRQNVQNSIATVIQTAIPYEERSNLGAEGMVCSTEELFERLQFVQDGDVIKLFPTQFMLDRPLIINKNISFVPLFPEKVTAFVSDLNDPIVFQGNTATFEKLVFIRVTDTENAKLPFFNIQDKSPVFNSCTFMTKQNAVSIRGADSNPEFNNCLFVGSASTHVYSSDNASGTFDGCEFESGGTAINLGNGAKTQFKNCMIHNVDYGITISENACGQFKSCDIFDFHNFGVGTTGVNKSEFEECKIHANKHEHKIALPLYENKGNLVATSIKSAYKGFSLGFNKIKSNLWGGAKSNEESQSSDAQPSLDDDDENNCAVGAFLNNKSTGYFTDCSFYGTNGNVIFVDESSSITLNKCNIHNGKRCGIFVTNESRAELQECSLDSCAENNLLASNGGIAVCSSCKVLNAGDIGIHCDSSGECRFTQCQIFQNKSSGMLLENNSMAVVDQCSISQNNGFGISLTSGSGGQFTNNELTDNKTLMGSVKNWNLSPDVGSVLRDGNKPNA